jgi:hypothetical protein
MGMPSLRTFATILLLLALFSVTAGAEAHSGATRYLEARPTDSGATLIVRVDAATVGTAVGIGVEASAERLAERAALVRAFMLRGIELSAGGEPCRHGDGALGVEGDRVAVTIDAVCGAGERALRDTSLADGHQTVVTLASDGVEATSLLRNPGDAVGFAAPASFIAVSGSFLWQGAVHLVTGYDHILFVMSLVLAAGLVAREQGKRKALREVALIVSAFTLGHSITLVAAALGLVALPAALVESAIAASIIVVAAMNVLRPDSALGRPQVALAFGLIHGFGFSSVLAEVGLPAAQHAAALFAFNLGIELAQLVVVAVLLVPLAWLAQQRFYRGVVMQAGSCAIALCAGRWLLERALGV